MPAAIEVVRWLAVHSAELDASHKVFVEVQRHVSEGSRKAQEVEEAMHPFVPEAVEVLEVIDRANGEWQALQKGGLKVSLGIP